MTKGREWEGAGRTPSSLPQNHAASLGAPSMAGSSFLVGNEVSFGFQVGAMSVLANCCCN